MVPSRWGILVRADSDIRSIADLKGKRLPFGHNAGPLFHFIYVGILANGGLTYDDVERVPVVLFREAWNEFKQGKVDTAVTLVGSGINNEMNATIPSGVRYIPFDDSPAARERMLAQTPMTYLTLIDPAPGLTGVVEPTLLAVYDYTLYTSKAAPDDVVYKAVKALHENEGELMESGALFRTFSANNMAKNQGIAYHPGAEKYYREVGILAK
jgi:TRAP transporter TAXI family solute receptor